MLQCPSYGGFSLVNSPPLPWHILRAKQNLCPTSPAATHPMDSLWPRIGLTRAPGVLLVSKHWSRCHHARNTFNGKLNQSSSNDKTRRNAFVKLLLIPQHLQTTSPILDLRHHYWYRRLVLLVWDSTDPSILFRFEFRLTVTHCWNWQNTTQNKAQGQTTKKRRHEAPWSSLQLILLVDTRFPWIFAQQNSVD